MGARARAELRGGHAGCGRGLEFLRLARQQMRQEVRLEWHLRSNWRMRRLRASPERACQYRDLQARLREHLRTRPRRAQLPWSLEVRLYPRPIAHFPLELFLLPYARVQQTLLGGRMPRFRGRGQRKRRQTLALPQAPHTLRHVLMGLDRGEPGPRVQWIRWTMEAQMLRGERTRARARTSLCAQRQQLGQVVLRVAVADARCLGCAGTRTPASRRHERANARRRMQDLERVLRTWLLLV
jgi:hypothetical protein